MILQCDNLQHTKCLYICLTTYIQLVFVLCVVHCFKIVNESYGPGWKYQLEMVTRLNCYTRQYMQ